MDDFKLKCWARMLVNGSHDDETVPPNVSSFATEPKCVVKSSTSTSTCSTSAQPSKREMDATGVNEAQIKARGLILGQCHSNEEFQEQKKMLEDLKKPNCTEQ
ncbi:uncharacterized protein LOC116304688 [Actinia tenebrosa]|uniref:Uncharacterized protein LOC116304688 n=1 Tax=Actinia tenebrosa TaxID=6105 RepID=A0A6P8IT00_ACTTE|nr:uncharacterized protein LOC116304688 [Actinia tenebrosa]